MTRLIAALFATLLFLNPASATANSLTIGLSQYPSTLHPTID